MDWRKYFGLLKQTAQNWSADRCPSMGAALSYYTLFSVAPLLLIVISVAGLFLGRDAAQGAIVGQLDELIGRQGAEGVQALLQNVAEPDKGIIGTVVGVVLLLVGATTVFAELQQDLNHIWKAEDPARAAGLWNLIRTRLLSIGLILAIGFLLLVSLVVSAAIAAMGNWSVGLLGNFEWLAHLINFALSFAVVTTLFALIYRFMPSVRIEWHDVWIGAAVTALLFTIGKWAIGLYIGKSAVASGFGAAGSVAVLLVWVYYSAQIFLFGAEFTAVYSHSVGSRRHMTQPQPGIPGAAASARAPNPVAVGAGPQGRPTVPTLPTAHTRGPAPAPFGSATVPADIATPVPLTTTARDVQPPHGAMQKARSAARSPLTRLVGTAALSAAAVVAGTAWWDAPRKRWMQRRAMAQRRAVWQRTQQRHRPMGWT